MWREFLIVGAGSFFGGGTRYLVSRFVETLAPTAFPFGTLAVNVLGCLLIGFISGFDFDNGWLGPNTKLILTTGFCGGFTTFSTFMKEGATLASGHDYLLFSLYLFGSLAIGLLAFLAGHAACTALK